MAPWLLRPAICQETETRRETSLGSNARTSGISHKSTFRWLRNFAPLAFYVAPEPNKCKSSTPRTQTRKCGEESTCKCGVGQKPTSPLWAMACLRAKFRGLGVGHGGLMVRIWCLAVAVEDLKSFKLRQADELQQYPSTMLT